VQTQLLARKPSRKCWSVLYFTTTFDLCQALFSVFLNKVLAVSCRRVSSSLNRIPPLPTFVNTFFHFLLLFELFFIFLLDSSFFLHFFYYFNNEKQQREKSTRNQTSLRQYCLLTELQQAFLPGQYFPAKKGK